MGTKETLTRSVDAEAIPEVSYIYLRVQIMLFWGAKLRKTLEGVRLTLLWEGGERNKERSDPNSMYMVSKAPLGN